MVAIGFNSNKACKLFFIIVQRIVRVVRLVSFKITARVVRSPFCFAANGIFLCQGFITCFLLGIFVSRSLVRCCFRAESRLLPRLSVPVVSFWISSEIYS